MVAYKGFTNPSVQEGQPSEGVQTDRIAYEFIVALRLGEKKGVLKRDG